jgi:hypothetical protein
MSASEGSLEKAMALMKILADAPDGTFKMEPRKTLQQGCATTLVAALDPELESVNGAYLHNGDVATMVVPTEALASMENQERLWSLSERMVGEKFNW